MSLLGPCGESERLRRYLADAIPRGPHPEPHAEWISVRLDVVQESIDCIEWLEKGNEEWRLIGLESDKQAKVAGANARIAVAHLHAVLNKPRTHAEQQAADTAARDWLMSIGSEPA